MMSLMKFPQGKAVRIVDIAGGETVRRRLFSLGFHVGDEIERSSGGIFHGPVLLKHIGSGIVAAVGRGIAQKIMAEAIDVRS